MNAETIKKDDEVFFAGSFFKVAEIKNFPHGKMVGIFDEPKTQHIDYINPDNLFSVHPCCACQGGGCPVCSGYGKIVGN